MSDAKRDANRIPTLIGVSSVDGVTPALVEIIPSTGRLKVDAIISEVSSVISTTNSTTAVLGSGGIYTGTGEDVSDYKTIGILVKASHASATNGMTFQFSPDGTNWDKVHSFTLPAVTATFYNIPVEAEYFRIVYTNSANIQTYFRLQTIYHATLTKESTLRLSEDISGELAAQLSRSVIAAKIPAGTFTNIQATTAGNLKVSIEEMDSGGKLLVASKYATNSVDDYTTASVTYIGKEGSSTADWWFVKIDETGNFPVFTHATVLNNPTVLTYADAYTARATTLVYGNYNTAF